MDINIKSLLSELTLSNIEVIQKAFSYICMGFDGILAHVL